MCIQVENVSSVSLACRKRRLNGVVSRNNRIKRLAPCRCFFIPPAHLCTVTYITEISLHMTLTNQTQTHYCRGQNYRKEIAVFRLFCNQNQEKQKKIPEDSRLTQALSDSILFVSKFKVLIWGNPAFFDPSFCCTFRSHRTLLSEAVFLWA